MRSEAEGIQTCPTCNSSIDENSELGLRDYRWLNEFLPGRESPMDGDGILEKKGHVLLWEAKPRGKRIPPGQYFTLRSLARLGVHVLGIWEKGDDVYEWKWMTKGGNWIGKKRGSRVDLVEVILKWRDDANEGRL